VHAHYLQHVPFEGLDCIEKWLINSGYEITSTKLYKLEQLPSIDDIDLLIIMGGSMSVNDENEFPWLLKEKNFIRHEIESGKATLGICLGAQLIASSMEADIFASSEKEIGWFPIQALQNKITLFLTFRKS
jgi:GMP synthase-like glutamine amidotransferase